jgi:hypothetical protein
VAVAMAQKSEMATVEDESVTGDGDTDVVQGSCPSDSRPPSEDFGEGVDQSDQELEGECRGF